MTTEEINVDAVIDLADEVAGDTNYSQESSIEAYEAIAAHCTMMARTIASEMQ